MQDTYEKIYCRICNNLFSRITGKHTAQHGISVKTYTEQFPSAPVVSQQSNEIKKKSASRANAHRKGVPRSSITVEKIKKSKAQNPKLAWNKGIPRTEEQNLHLSLIRKQKFQSGEIVHWNTGKTVSVETKQKISNTLLIQNRHYRPKSLEKRKITIEHKKQFGWVHHSTLRRGTPSNLTEEARNKIRTAANKNNKKRINLKNSRISTLLMDYNLELQFTDDYNYDIKCKVCNTTFSRTVSVFAPYRYELYKGEYCPMCYPNYRGYYSKELFDIYPEIKETPGVLYIAAVHDNEERFVKIGITKHNAITRLRSEHGVYNFDILVEHHMTIEQAFHIEQCILSEFVDFKYHPIKEFGGKTECFDIGVLDELKALNYL